MTSGDAYKVEAVETRDSIIAAMKNGALGRMQLATGFTKAVTDKLNNESIRERLTQEEIDGQANAAAAAAEVVLE